MIARFHDDGKHWVEIERFQIPDSTEHNNLFCWYHIAVLKVAVLAAFSSNNLIVQSGRSQAKKGESEMDERNW